MGASGPEPDPRSALSVEVGSRLRDRREELGTSLRDVASRAGVSPAHLSEIENGRSHASLPVLLRLCRALQYPLGDLLPRIGGHRVRQGSIPLNEPPEELLSHPDLEMRVSGIELRAGESRLEKIEPGEDVIVFVVSGQGDIEVDGTTYELFTHDTADIEHAASIGISTPSELTLLLCRGRSD